MFVHAEPRSPGEGFRTTKSTKNTKINVRFARRSSFVLFVLFVVIILLCGSTAPREQIFDDATRSRTKLPGREKIDIDGDVM